jgi:hypothetical protein
VCVTWWEGQGLGVLESRVLGEGVLGLSGRELQGSGGDRVRISCMVCAEHRLLLWPSNEEE